MSIIAQTGTTANQNCPAWCLHHDTNVENLCIGPAIELDFGAPNPTNPQAVHHTRILTYNEPGNVVTISLVLNSTDSGDLTPAQARQIGIALIQAANAADTAPQLRVIEGGAR